MRLLFLAAPLALAACQATTEPQPEITPAAVALAGACLDELGKEVDLSSAPDNGAVVLTPEEQAAYEACVQRRAAEL